MKKFGYYFITFCIVSSLVVGVLMYKAGYTSSRDIFWYLWYLSLVFTGCIVCYDQWCNPKNK